MLAVVEMPKIPRRAGRSPSCPSKRFKLEKEENEEDEGLVEVEGVVMGAQYKTEPGADTEYLSISDVTTLVSHKVEGSEEAGENEQVVLEESEVCESLSVTQDDDAAENFVRIELAHDPAAGAEDEEEYLEADLEAQEGEEGEEGEEEEESQKISVQHMNILEPIETLRSMIQGQLGISLEQHVFWLRDLTPLDASKSLASQCVQTTGLVQVNLEIKHSPSPTINIVDILKASDEPVSPTMVMTQRIQKFRPKPKHRVRVSAVPAEARWVIDAQFKEAMQTHAIPEDPMEWTVEHVRYWLQWASTHFPLDGLDIDSVQLVGSDVCALSAEDVRQLAPGDTDDLFRVHVELLSRCKIVAVNQPLGAYAEDDLEASRRYASMQGRGNRSGNNGQIQLWQFLLELLTDATCTDLIQWVGDQGEFKLNNHEGVARMWGQRKNKPNMNYEKLSRALRYYYDGDLIAKVSGKRFTYKFICDLKSVVGFTPAEIQRLVECPPTAHLDHAASSAEQDVVDTERARLDQLRESLRLPGAIRRPPTYIALEPQAEMLIIDGTS